MANSLSQHTIERDSRLPFYAQLKRVLEEQMESGNLAPGDLLPSEGELCGRFGVSRTVVRQAIGELVTEGRLYRMRGKGTFVAARKLSEHFLQTPLGFFEDLTASGHVVSSEVLRCDEAPATDAVAKALDLGAGDACVMLDRLRYVNGELTAFTKSFLPTRLHPQLLERLGAFDLRSRSLYRFLEDECAVRIHSGHRSVEAVRATRELAKLLEVRSGDPLLYIQSIARDATGRALEHFEAWHRGDRARLEMDVVRRP
jgi:GntR family transcriptional regulator